MYDCAEDANFPNFEENLIIIHTVSRNVVCYD